MPSPALPAGRVRTIRMILAIALPLMTLAPRVSAEHWPQWRGPEGTGVGMATDLPTKWGPEQNIVWKTAMPSWSGSSPVVWGEHVFVMSPSELPQASADAQPTEPAEGRRGRGRGGRSRAGATAGPGGPDILLLCLSRSDGSILWRHKLDSGNHFRMKHNSTSPSPVTDGKTVWTVTGNGTVTAIDFDGKERWRFDIQKTYGTFGQQFGYASSPLLHDGKLFCQVLHGMRTTDPSYVMAFDAATGKVLWRRERPTDARSESPDAYTTPALVRNADRSHQIVVVGGDYVTGHDLATGNETWRAGGLNPRNAGNYRIVASPVVAGEMIFAFTRRTPFLALRAGGAGDVTESHLAWKWDRSGAPDVPTPACDGELLYLADDRGLLTCVNVKSGEAIWGPHDLGIGSVSASPVLADGKLFILSESGECAVVKAGQSYELLGTNQLDGSFTLSTPAAVGTQLFIRTATHLYCIAKPTSE